jgi:hypothetical protein
METIWLVSFLLLCWQPEYHKSCYTTGCKQWTFCTVLQVILTPTCRVSGYPRQVIKVATLLRQLRFIWTALPTVITLITIIPLGTYNTSSWYIFVRADATSLVHLSSLMTAVCLSLLTRLLHWTASFTDCFLFYSLDLSLTALLLYLCTHCIGDTTFDCSVVGSTG